MDKDKFELIQAIKGLEDAFYKLNDAWGKADNDEFMLEVHENSKAVYPFHKSFDELTLEVSTWSEIARNHLAYNGLKFYMQINDEEFMQEQLGWVYHSTEAGPANDGEIILYNEPQFCTETLKKADVVEITEEEYIAVLQAESFEVSEAILAKYLKAKEGE